MSSPSPSTSRSSALVALSACCFGAISIFTLVATGAGVPLASVLVGRYALAAPLFALVAWGQLRTPLTPRKHGAMLLLGGGQAVIAGLGLSALRYIPAATAAFVFYTYPAWVALAAAARGTEALTPRRMLALAISLGGVLAMVGAPAERTTDLRGVAFSLSAAVAYSLYILLANRMQRGTTPSVFSMHIAAGAFLAIVAYGTLNGTLVLELPLRAWMAIVGLAVVSTVIGFNLWLRGLAVLGPVRTAIISTVEPFCTAILGFFVLGQPFTTGTLLGGCMIAAAVLLLQRREASRVQQIDA
ncbi:MAG: DMT family transporter [Gemmatimonadaceae bacterium]